MKKILLLCAMLLAGVAASNAQAVFGVRVGANYSVMKDSDGASYKGKPGIDVGPVIYYSLKNNLYLNSGLLFSMNNYESDGTVSVGSSTTPFTYKESVSYIDVPVHIGYVFGSGKINFYAQAGPYFGIKVAEKRSISGGGGVVEANSEDQYNGFNAGIGGALGVNLNRFKVELGYKQGLTNIWKDTTDDYSVTLGNTFLGVSYVF